MRNILMTVCAITFVITGLITLLTVVSWYSGRNKVFVIDFPVSLEYIVIWSISTIVSMAVFLLMFLLYDAKWYNGCRYEYVKNDKISSEILGGFIRIPMHMSVTQGMPLN